MRAVSGVIALTLVGALGLAGCATDEYGNRLPMTDQAKGGLIGGVGGAAIGALVASNPATGALIGAVGGGIAGALVGRYMDNQNKDLRRQLQAQINSGDIRIESLPENRLLIRMTSETAFAVNSAQIKPGFYGTMNKISQVVNRYGKTQLIIVGHTDSTGSPQYNKALSERRAQSVQQYFLGQGVMGQRLKAYGAGEADPVASNATPEGRALNRRVDIVIVPVVAKG